MTLTSANTMNAGLTVRVRDGRRLGYAEYGDPAGFPVMFFHGTPGSRLKGSICADAAAGAGARLICPERPGYGLSDPKRGRRLLDWPDDVVDLAAGLGIDRFAVVGISGGGPHTVACAYKIPERLTAVAILAGAGPFGPTAGTTPKLRNMMRLARRYPSSLRPALWLLTRILRRWPDATMKRINATECAFDAAVLRDYEAIYVADALESLRRGSDGLIGDTAILARPWGFRIEDVAIKVYLWHGDLDDTVVPEVARYMAKTLPQCEATFLPDAGHLLFARYMDTVLASLAPH